MLIKAYFLMKYVFEPHCRESGFFKRLCVGFQNQATGFY